MEGPTPGQTPLLTSRCSCKYSGCVKMILGILIGIAVTLVALEVYLRMNDSSLMDYCGKEKATATVPAVAQQATQTEEKSATIGQEAKSENKPEAKAVDKESSKEEEAIKEDMADSDME